MIPDAEKIRALIEKIRETGAPDRALDFEIVTTLCPGATVGHYMADDDGDIVFHASDMGIRDKSVCPFFLSDLSAARSLVPRMLSWRVTEWARLREATARLEDGPESFGRTAEEALVLACLMRRIEKL